MRTNIRRASKTAVEKGPFELAIGKDLYLITLSITVSFTRLPYLRRFFNGLIGTVKCDRPIGDIVLKSTENKLPNLHYGGRAVNFLGSFIGP